MMGRYVIVGAIRSYIESPGLRRAHGKAAAEFVKERFSLERMLDAFEEVYLK